MAINTHFVYKTTNIINDKIYVGVHTTKDILTCKYQGSGDALKKAMKFYGKENFITEIIKICETRDDAFELEALIVDRDFVKSSNTYNIKIGGKGGYDDRTKPVLKISEIQKAHIASCRTLYCWITNEIVNRQHLKSDPIPEGWKRGRKISMPAWSDERKLRHEAKMESKRKEKEKLKASKPKKERKPPRKRTAEEIEANKIAQRLASARRKELGIPHGNKGKKMPEGMNEKRLASRARNKQRHLEGF